MLLDHLHAHNTHLYTPHHSAIGLHIGKILCCLSLLVLAGCSHDHNKPPPVSSRLQPPPPGGSDPYPTIGIIPTQPPQLPTQQARDLLTQQLKERRNLTYRTVAQNGTLIPEIPLSPRQRKAILGHSDDPRRAILLKDPNAPIPNTDLLQATPQPKTPKVAQRKANGELAMPALEDKYTRDDNHQPSPYPTDHPPDIPDEPPPIPHVKGFQPRFDSLRAENDIAPRYNLADIDGMSFHFVPQSDELSPHQDKKFHKLLDKNPDGPFIIYGFGNTTSLQASDQAVAIKLGLLRARRVAQEIMTRGGIHQDSIAIHAYAFGTGVKVVVPSQPPQKEQPPS